MPNDPRPTVKFQKVMPVGTPPRTTSDELESMRASPSEPTAEPDWYDDPPTIPGTQAPVVAPVVAASPDRATLTVLGGLNAGQVFTLDRDESSIGRGRDADIRIDDAGISRKHARIQRADEGRHVLQDLGSANGIFVNGRRVERVDLVDGDRVQIGPTVVLRFGVVTADEETLARRLYEGSTRDGMTQLYNRKYASERLVAEVAYAHRHGSFLSLIVSDIDHFKRVNDTFGHLAGDVVLRVVAAQMQKAIRAEDVLARYGGEEFVVIVRGIEQKNVYVLADRIRRSVERLSIPWEARTLKITMSLGVASLEVCGPNATADELVAFADARLYRAKDGGRNRVF
jgi:two-component system cell cycle response regulator